MKSFTFKQVGGGVFRLSFFKPLIASSLSLVLTSAVYANPTIIVDQTSDGTKTPTLMFQWQKKDNKYYTPLYGTGSTGDSQTSKPENLEIWFNKTQQNGSTASSVSNKNVVIIGGTTDNKVKLEITDGYGLSVNDGKGSLRANLAQGNGSEVSVTIDNLQHSSYALEANLTINGREEATFNGTFGGHIKNGVTFNNPKATSNITMKNGANIEGDITINGAKNATIKFEGGTGTSTVNDASDSIKGLSQTIVGNIITGRLGGTLSITHATLKGNVGGQTQLGGIVNGEKLELSFDNSKMIGNVLNGTPTDASDELPKNITFKNNTQDDIVLEGNVISYGRGVIGATNQDLDQGIHLTFEKGSMKGNISALHVRNRGGRNALIFKDTNGSQSITGNIETTAYSQAGRNDILFEGNGTINGNATTKADPTTGARAGGVINIYFKKDGHYIGDLTNTSGSISITQGSKASNADVNKGCTNCGGGTQKDSVIKNDSISNHTLYLGNETRFVNIRNSGGTGKSISIDADHMNAKINELSNTGGNISITTSSIDTSINKVIVAGGGTGSISITTDSMNAKIDELIAQGNGNSTNTNKITTNSGNIHIKSMQTTLNGGANSGTKNTNTIEFGVNGAKSNSSLTIDTISSTSGANIINSKADTNTIGTVTANAQNSNITLSGSKNSIDSLAVTGAGTNNITFDSKNADNIINNISTNTSNANGKNSIIVGAQASQGDAASKTTNTTLKITGNITKGGEENTSKGSTNFTLNSGSSLNLQGGTALIDSIKLGGTNTNITLDSSSHQQNVNILILGDKNGGAGNNTLTNEIATQKLDITFDGGNGSTLSIGGQNKEIKTSGNGIVNINLKDNNHSTINGNLTTTPTTQTTMQDSGNTNGINITFGRNNASLSLNGNTTSTNASHTINTLTSFGTNNTINLSGQAYGSSSTPSRENFQTLTINKIDGNSPINFILYVNPNAGTNGGTGANTISTLADADTTTPKADRIIIEGVGTNGGSSGKATTHKV